MPPMKYCPAPVTENLKTHTPSLGCSHQTALIPAADSFVTLSGIETRRPRTRPSAVAATVAL